MKNKLYLSYQIRLTSIITLLVLSIILSFYFLGSSFKIFDKNEIKYQETNNMDYTVTFKENNLFEEKEMSSDLNYIASIIDKVKINYNYLFTPEELIKGTYNYNVVATVNIIDHLTGELYYEKDYVLIDTIDENILKSKLKINNNIEIDYEYFKNIVNKLLPYYNENAKANLNISFNVNKKLNTQKYHKNNLNKTVTSNIIIPLISEPENIKFATNNYSKKNKLVLIKEFNEKDDSYLLISIVLDVLITYLIIKLVKLLSALKIKENKYDKKLNYIRRKYNKIIVDIETQPDFTEYHTTKISKFNELLDVRNSYKDPIRFFEVTPHNKAYFFIIHKNEIFIYTLKNVDLEQEKD